MTYLSNSTSKDKKGEVVFFSREFLVLIVINQFITMYVWKINYKVTIASARIVYLFFSLRKESILRTRWLSFTHNRDGLVCLKVCNASMYSYSSSVEKPPLAILLDLQLTKEMTLF